MYQRWLLFIYKVPQNPPGRRTYVWRQLKQLGAVYLQQAAAILPNRPEVHSALAALATHIRATQGEVSLLATTSPDQDWEQELIARFNQARDDEYAELLENVERFEAELRRESQKGKFTFAELEDSETDWDKIEHWLPRVKARDFFGARGHTRTLEALAHGRAALEQFAMAVYHQEGLQDPSERRSDTP
jgi:hypothetical protein